MKYQTIHIDYIRELKEREQFKNDFNSMIRGLKLGLIIAFLIILLVYGLSGRISLVNGDGNIYYTFQNDNMFNATSSYNFESGYPSDTINVRDSREYGGNYSATYSFDNEVGLENDSIEFVDVYNTPVEIISNYMNHDSVMNITFNDNYYYVINQWYDHSEIPTEITHGTIECWLNTPLTNKASRLNFYQGSTLKFQIIFRETGQISFYNGSFNDLRSYTSHTWYHIRVDFNTDDLIASIYIDGVLEAENYIIPSMDYVSRFGFSCLSQVPITYSIDAIGYYFYEYKGTYTFQDEIGDTGTDIEPITSITYPEHAEVIDFVNEHRSVLNLTTLDVRPVTANTILIDFGENRIDGIVQFWYSTTNSSSYTYLYLSSSENGFRFRIQGGYLYNFETDTNYIAISNNVWYKFGFYFNCTTDTGSLYVNNILLDSDIPFQQDNSYLSKIKLVSFYGYADDYLDSIQYSWEDSYDITEQVTNYTIGQNIIPEFENTDYTYEADKWTFRYNENDITDLLDDGTDNPNGWTDIDPTQDYVNINHDAPYYADGYVNITSYAPLTSDRGIYKEFDYETGIINVTWTTNMTDIGGTGTEFYTKIYSYDDTLLTKVFFEYGAGGHYLEYNDGSDHFLYSTLSEGEEYTINVYINNNDSLACLTLYTNGEFNATHYITLANYEDGLGKIEFEITGSATYDQEIHLDDIGVYINGTSITSEPAILKTLTLTANEPIPYYWYFQEFNLFSFNMTGNSSIYLTETGYLEEISTIEQLAPYDYYNQSLEHINLYDFTFDALTYIEPCQLWFMFNNQYDFNSVSIDGVKLNDGTYEYIPTFDYGNVDPNESYFYVLSNSLYFYFQPDYPADYEEWISLSFDIDDFESTDYRLQFTGDKNNNSDVLFRLIWYDWIYTDIELGTTPTTFRLLLPTERTCDEVQFWAFSFYENQSALTSGYFSSFTMVYKPDFTDFSALSFVGIIPLLIMILGIPILLYVRTGVRKIIVPSVVIMSIFSVAFGIMDVWLFVVTMALIVAYFILKRKVDFE